MNPTKRTEVENFFRTYQKIQVMTDLQDTKKEITFYVNHEITDTELIVFWIMGNKIEFGDKEFNIQDFYAWVSDGCTDKKLWKIWVDMDKDDIGGKNGLQEVFDLKGYLEANESQLVTEYFNLHK